MNLGSLLRGQRQRRHLWRFAFDEYLHDRRFVEASADIQKIRRPERALQWREVTSKTPAVYEAIPTGGGSWIAGIGDRAGQHPLHARSFCRSERLSLAGFIHHREIGRDRRNLLTAEGECRHLDGALRQNLFESFRAEPRRGVGQIGAEKSTESEELVTGLAVVVVPDAPTRRCLFTQVWAR